MGVARKLFRLLKSLNEYQKIRNLLKNTTMDSTERQITILSRLAFFFYWIWDNITVLHKVNFFRFMDVKTSQRYASKFWLTGIVTGLILAVMGMIKTAKQEAMLIAKKKSNSLEQSDFNSQMANIQKAKVTNVLTFVKNFGDGITAS
jgi:hypothetical protein